MRKNKSIVDHIHTPRQIQETCNEHQMNMHVVFIVYDIIKRTETYKIEIFHPKEVTTVNKDDIEYYTVEIKSRKFTERKF